MQSKRNLFPFEIQVGRITQGAHIIGNNNNHYLFYSNQIRLGSDFNCLIQLILIMSF